jgi:hypothetical protein
MFQLEKVQAKISSVNPRAEKHGKENVPAIDVKFHVVARNHVLAGLDPTLPKLLFRKPAKDEVVQGELPVGETDELTARKFKHVPTIPWNEKLLGYELDIGSGLESTDPLECDEVTISGFKIEPMDGGSVGIDFTCSFPADENQSGKLCQMIQETVEITVRPPAEKQKDLADAA